MPTINHPRKNKVFLSIILSLILREPCEVQGFASDRAPRGFLMIPEL
jgi:hypothetical protein